MGTTPILASLQSASAGLSFSGKWLMSQWVEKKSCPEAGWSAVRRS